MSRAVLIRTALDLQYFLTGCYLAFRSNLFAAEYFFVSQPINGCIQHNDVIFYVGHARQGTGPGFQPFEAFSRSWWQALLPASSLDEMSRTLQAGRQHPKLIGLFACSTRQYYEQRIRQVLPDTALVLSAGTTYSDTDCTNLLEALNALLGRQCEQKFRQAIALKSNGATYHLEGFFRPHPAVTNGLDW